MATPTDTEENSQPDLQEMVGKKHGWQPKDEVEYFWEEIFPDLTDEEKKEVIELLPF